MSDPATNPEAVPDDVEVPGLAGERTDLAWSRSALAASVAGAVILRRLWEHANTTSARIIVSALLAVGAAVWIAALTWSHSTARTTMEGRRVADPHALRRVTIGTTIFSLAALILAILPPQDVTPWSGPGRVPVPTLRPELDRHTADRRLRPPSVVAVSTIEDASEDFQRAPRRRSDTPANLAGRPADSHRPSGTHDGLSSRVHQ